MVVVAASTVASTAALSQQKDEAVRFMQCYAKWQALGKKGREEEEGVPVSSRQQQQINNRIFINILSL